MEEKKRYIKNKDMIKKVYGVNARIHKISQLNTKWISFINDLNNECLDKITIRPYIKPNDKKGLNISIESPTCCINYAQMNCDRGVPLG